jgi:hypothetical protein
MRAAGYGKDEDKQRLIHEALQGLARKSYKVLLQFVKDLLD